MSKQFPILGTAGAVTIPWSVVEPHAAQAMRNHGQTLERLAERGGLSYTELISVLEDRPWFRGERADIINDRKRVLELVEIQEQKLELWKQKVKDNSVDAAHLEDWYINSVFENQWDLSQVKELVKDFYCIPKCVIDEEKIN